MTAMPPPGLSSDERKDWPQCDQCGSSALWSLASAENGDLNAFAVSAFACRRHLSYVAEYHGEAMAGMAVAVLIDLAFEGS